MQKIDILFFKLETNRNFENLRVAHPHEFFMRIWKKKLFRLKKTFKKNFKKKTFVKQYSWRSAASP